MASINISLHKQDAYVDSLTMSDGQTFMTLYPDGREGSVSIYLHGFDRGCVNHARIIAAALTKAADELEAKLPPMPMLSPEQEVQAALEAEANASLAAEANASLSASYATPRIADEEFF